MYVFGRLIVDMKRAYKLLFAVVHEEKKDNGQFIYSTISECVMSMRAEHVEEANKRGISSASLLCSHRNKVGNFRTGNSDFF